MNKKELPNHSAYLVTEFCKGNTQPYFDAFSDNCLWLGLTHKQIFYGKDALIRAINSDVNKLKYSIQNLQVIPMPINATVLNVVLIYTLLVEYPNGQSIVLQQRHILTWTEEAVKADDGHTYKKFFVRFCLLASELPYSPRDTIYPNHFLETDIAKIYTGKMNLCKFSLKGLNASFFYLTADTILWAESVGKHTLIHTTNKTYESIERLTAIADKYGEQLFRIHIGYLVNPQHVTKIGRFYVELRGGYRLSIPEKKYTKTRDELHRRIKELNKQNKTP